MRPSRNQKFFNPHVAVVVLNNFNIHVNRITLTIKRKIDYFILNIQSEKSEINVMFYVLANQSKKSVALNQLGSVRLKGFSLHLVNNGKQQSLLKFLIQMTSFLRYVHQK